MPSSQTAANTSKRPQPSWWSGMVDSIVADTYSFVYKQGLNSGVQDAVSLVDVASVLRLTAPYISSI
jgi:hypothetical protein